MRPYRVQIRVGGEQGAGEFHDGGDGFQVIAASKRQKLLHALAIFADLFLALQSFGLLLLRRRLHFQTTVHDHAEDANKAKKSNSKGKIKKS